MTIPRRALLGALAVSPLAISPTASIGSGVSDAALVAAWHRRQEAYAAYNALPEEDQEREDGYSPEERSLWDIIDAAEDTIRSSVASTEKGVMIQLWCAMQHMVTTRSDDEAVTRGDFAALDRVDTDLDWSERLILAAIRSLQAMEV